MHSQITPRAALLVLATTLLGTAVLGAGIAVAFFFHRGDPTGPFLLQNHFVSELGWIHHSRLAWAFNGSLTVGCLLFAPVFYALSLYFRTRLGWTATAFGLTALVAASAVGLFPMDHIEHHLVAALLFFISWVSAAALFTVAFWQDKNKYSMLLVAIGAAALISCALLLVFPKDSLIAAIRATQHHEPFYRPDIWWLAVMEWMVVFWMWLWMLACALFVWSARDRTPSPG